MSSSHPNPQLHANRPLTDKKISDKMATAHRAQRARKSDLRPPPPSSRYDQYNQYDFSYSTANTPRMYQPPAYDAYAGWDDNESIASSYHSGGAKVFEIDTSSQEEEFLPSQQQQQSYQDIEMIEPEPEPERLQQLEDEDMPRTVPPPLARNLTPSSDTGRGRKRKSSPAPSVSHLSCTICQAGAS